MVVNKFIERDTTLQVEWEQVVPSAGGGRGLEPSGEPKSPRGDHWTGSEGDADAAAAGSAVGEDRRIWEPGGEAAVKW